MSKERTLDTFDDNTILLLDNEINVSKTSSFEEVRKLVEAGLSAWKTSLDKLRLEVETSHDVSRKKTLEGYIEATQGVLSALNKYTAHLTTKDINQKMSKY